MENSDKIRTKIRYIIDTDYDGRAVDFARDLGIAQSTLSKYITEGKEKRNPGNKFLLKLKKLGYKTDKFLDDTIPASSMVKEPGPLNHSYATKNELAILQKLKELEKRIETLEAKNYRLIEENEKLKEKCSQKENEIKVLHLHHAQIDKAYEEIVKKKNK